MTNTMSSEQQPNASPSLRILIVDDEPVLLDMLLDIFHDEGFTVYTATNGEAALALLKQHAVDVVLTDFMMPRLSGIELAHTLRADPATANMPIVLMSAALLKEADESVTLIVTKPFVVEDLIEKVREVGA